MHERTLCPASSEHRASGLARASGIRSGRTYNRRVAIDIDIAYVARLARIELSDDELQHFGAQLKGILEHAALVQQLPTDGVEPTAHPLPMVNAFRPDQVTPPLERETALSQAPDAEAGYFRVPPTLEAE